MNREQILSQYKALMAEAELVGQRNQLFKYFPDHDTPGFPARERYQKQLEFFRWGKTKFARMFMASPGAGKTEPACCELAFHLRGWYPSWWEGRTYNRPLDLWISGATFKSTRDIVQTKFFGRPFDEGTGILPYDWIDLDSISRIQNVKGGIEFVRVRHVSGGFSNVWFKCQEQGIRVYYGSEIDIFYADEPHDEEIFAQGCARTRDRENPMAMYTVAPLEGNTETVKLFLEKPDPDRIVVQAGWADAPHLTDEWKRQQLSITPLHLHDAFINGNPTGGVGKVYTIPEDQFVIEPIQIPRHFEWLYGFDGGFHNTAAVFLAKDPDKDVVYVVSDYKDGGVDETSGETIDYTIHATRIKARSKVLAGFDMPGFGDAAAINISDGKKLLALYRDAGLNLRLADKAVVAGIDKVREMLANGKLKIFRTCVGLLKELRNYAYGEDQKPIKTDDHEMDALRYAVMHLDKAESKQSNSVSFSEVRFG